MEVEATKYLSTSTDIYTIDDVVVGVHPTDVVLSDLHTGIEYTVHTKAYTSGFNHGYSVASDVLDISVGLPAEAPPSIDGLLAKNSLQVNEVQEIIVAGSHVTEIQTISTYADLISEIQDITMTSPSGTVVGDQMFTLRLPEVQILTLSATDAASYTGTFKLKYSYFDYDNKFPNTRGSVASDYIYDATTSSCLDVTSSAEDIEAALEALSVIDDVEVSKSGTGSYSDAFGYSWTITFSGNFVAGDVQDLEVVTTGCALASDVTATVTTLDKGPAVGLDTEVHTIVVSADDEIVQGQYQVTYKSEVSSCIPWNATADELKAALDDVSSIDSVFVERNGDGDMASSYGYTYSVFFVGNGHHYRNGTGEYYNMLSISSCSSANFSYFDESVLTAFGDIAGNVDTTLNRNVSFSLDSDAISASVIEEKMQIMPSFLSIIDVRQSPADDQNGFRWTFVFNESMGNVRPLICGQQDAGLVTCTHRTVVDGNVIGGNFLVSGSRLLPSDISAADLEYELEMLLDMGDLAVTRSDASNQDGYIWTVTWLTAPGNRPELTVSNILTGSGSTIVVNTVRDGNSLAGSFSLSYKGKATDAIPFDSPEQ